MGFTYGLHHNTGNLVRIGVGSWSSVLEVTITIVATFSGNTDRATTVGDTRCEGVNATSLVAACKTHGVVLSVDGNVLLVAALELLDSSLNVLHTTGLAHLLAREVGVKTSSIPVTWDGLGVERDLGAELLGNSVEEETSEPEVVTHCDSLASFHRTNFLLTHTRYPHKDQLGTPIGLA